MGFDGGPSLGHEGVDFGLGLKDGVRGVLAEVADQLRVWGHLERARVREVLEVVRNGERTERLLLRGVGVGEQLLGLGRQSVEPRLLLGVDDPDRVDVVAAGDARALKEK